MNLASLSVVNTRGVPEDRSLKARIVGQQGRWPALGVPPILKQGGNSNSISIVNGMRNSLKDLLDVPKTLVTRVVFDQSVFVKTAIANLGKEGGIGLVLTEFMILIFLGSFRATIAALLSIPLSAVAAFLAINAGGGSINSMVLGGLALAFSRLIDNSVVVLENIFRHLEEGESPEVAAERGGQEVALPVLAATFTTAIVFFPVVFLYGVSRFLFMALAASVVFSLFASYMVAMTVVPLFCARFIKGHGSVAHYASKTAFARFVSSFNHKYDRMLMHYDIAVGKTLKHPTATVFAILGVCVFSLGLYLLLGVSFFPRTDPGQFVINIKAPTETLIELTNEYIKHVEEDNRQVVPTSDLGMIISNIGITPDFSAIYITNSGQHTSFVQVSLKEDHKVGSYEYMDRVRRKLSDDLPELSTYFQTGGLVDAVVNLGLPAPIDLEVSSSDMNSAYATAQDLARKIRGVRGVSDVLVPQDLDYPGISLAVNREMAAKLGLSSKEVVDNVNIPIFNGFLYPARSREAALRTGQTGAVARLEGPHRERRVHQLTERRCCLQPDLGDAAVCRPDQSRGGPVADALHVRAGLDRGIEPGAAAANRSADPVRRGEVSVPDCRGSAAVSDCGAVTNCAAG